MSAVTRRQIPIGLADLHRLKPPWLVKPRAPLFKIRNISKNQNLTHSNLQIGGRPLQEYSINPELCYSKSFPFAVALFQTLTIGFLCLGHYVTYIVHLLALLCQFCAFYFLYLFFYNKNYRLHITTDRITVWNLRNKPRQYDLCAIRWKIKRIPWYNTYFALLYSSGQTPIAIVKPHWKNVNKLLQLPHHGPLTTVEREYVKFLKSVGLMY